MAGNTPIWNRADLLRSPLFTPLHPVLSALGDACFPTIQTCNDMLALRQQTITVKQGSPLRFVPQVHGKQGFEAQYEPRCYLKGEVQMRENNWHDLFNALVWLTFPKSKAEINASHYHALMEDRDPVTGSQRGAIRDAATLVDESGVIVVCSDAELVSMLREFRWKELFWHQRELVQSSMEYCIFGHGLYEKAMHPYIGMCGQGVILTVEQSFFGHALPERLAAIDAMLSGCIVALGSWKEHDMLTPVPLLGIPGWDVANEQPSYYENTAYFRRGRRA